MEDAINKIPDVDLLLFYYETVDECGHGYGPESDQVMEAMRKADLLIQDLMNGLDNMTLSDQLRVKVLAMKPSLMIVVITRSRYTSSQTMA